MVVVLVVVMVVVEVMKMMLSKASTKKVPNIQKCQQL
jgi:beta-lactam-binding protein with PASTA domain